MGGIGTDPENWWKKKESEAGPDGNGKKPFNPKKSKMK